jgi:hypothetical protein
LLACKANELAGTADDGAAFWGPSNSDSAAAPELEQTFVAEESEGAEDSVRIDPEDRG